MKEFIEGVHLKKYEKLIDSQNYVKYLMNRYSTRNFQIALSLSSLITFHIHRRHTKLYFNYRYQRYFFNIHLFSFLFLYFYQYISNRYGDEYLFAFFESKYLNDN